MAQNGSGAVAAIPDDESDRSGWTFAAALRAVTGEGADLRLLSAARWFVAGPNAGAPGDGVSYDALGRRYFGADIDRAAVAAYERAVDDLDEIMTSVREGRRGTMDGPSLGALTERTAEIEEVLARHGVDHRRWAAALGADSAQTQGKAASVLRTALERFAAALESWHEDLATYRAVSRRAAEARSALDSFRYATGSAWSAERDAGIRGLVRQAIDVEVALIVEHLAAAQVVAGRPNYVLDSWDPVRNPRADLDAGSALGLPGSTLADRVGRFRDRADGAISAAVASYPKGDLRSAATWDRINRDVTATVAASIDRMDEAARREMRSLGAAYQALSWALSPRTMPAASQPGPARQRPPARDGASLGSDPAVGSASPVGPGSPLSLVVPTAAEPVWQPAPTPTPSPLSEAGSPVADVAARSSLDSGGAGFGPSGLGSGFRGRPEGSSITARPWTGPSGAGSGPDGSSSPLAIGDQGASTNSAAAAPGAGAAPEERVPIGPGELPLPVSNGLSSPGVGGAAVVGGGPLSPVSLVSSAGGGAADRPVRRDGLDGAVSSGPPTGPADGEAQPEGLLGRPAAALPSVSAGSWEPDTGPSTALGATAGDVSAQPGAGGAASTSPWSSLATVTGPYADPSVAVLGGGPGADLAGAQADLRGGVPQIDRPSDLLGVGPANRGPEDGGPAFDGFAGPNTVDGGPGLGGPGPGRPGPVGFGSNGLGLGGPGSGGPGSGGPGSGGPGSGGPGSGGPGSGGPGSGGPGPGLGDPASGGGNGPGGFGSGGPAVGGPGGEGGWPGATRTPPSSLPGATMAGPGGMPFLPPMVGGGVGGEHSGRRRQTWLSEDEDVWGIHPAVGSGVVGAPGAAGFAEPVFADSAVPTSDHSVIRGHGAGTQDADGTEVVAPRS